jgi:hypothetical protein
MESCLLEGVLLQHFTFILGMFFDKHLIFRRVFFYKETPLFKLTIPYVSFYMLLQLIKTDDDLRQTPHSPFILINSKSVI